MLTLLVVVVRVIHGRPRLDGIGRALIVELKDVIDVEAGGPVLVLVDSAEEMKLN